MAGGHRNQPQVSRGAFVEYPNGPLKVTFQFNPVQLTRSCSLSFSVPGSEPAATPQPGAAQPGAPRSGTSRPGAGARQGTAASPVGHNLRDLHMQYDDLEAVRDAQEVRVQEESMSFELRLDATDKLNEGDPVARRFGIAPQLAALELMLHPKMKTELGESGDLRFTGTFKPPLILFIWGRRWVLPVNVDSLSITETEFSPSLQPIRATVAVRLTVIEGPSDHYKASLAAKVSAAATLAAVEVATVDIPG